jgi:FolB domain-containing protein
MADGGDKILIRGLLVRGILGINDWERQKEQDILINLTVHVDCRGPGASDDVAEALNYRTLTKAVIAYVESSAHYLVEALATSIARICVVDLGAEQVVVRVEKPGALRFAESVGVEIRRRRADFDGV